MLENLFGLDSVCDEIISLYAHKIVSTYALHVHAIFFFNYSKILN
jgi:hypothetical protein